jgi:hypothetical protein
MATSKRLAVADVLFDLFVAMKTRSLRRVSIGRAGAKEQGRGEQQRKGILHGFLLAKDQLNDVR